MSQIKRPSLLLAALETRAIYELGAFTLAFPFLQATPYGDGHPVIVYPGFMTSDWSTVPMRTYLNSRGYTTYGWGLGRNLGRGVHPIDGVPDDAQSLKLIRRLFKKHGRKITLIGWSLGGIYAREFARKVPHMVRQVITLGSPFNGRNPQASNVVELFEWVSGHKISTIDPDLIEQISEPPPVPVTAIYTETDGIAAWECCIERESDRTENIGILSSHTGLGHNPLALWIIADRLAQKEQLWKPFDRSGLKSLLYMQPNVPLGAW